jgi:elongation of very long chain fatty acids protein 6
MSEKSSSFYKLDQLQEVAISTIDSVLSLNTAPMFDIKPINTQLNSNETYKYTYSYESLFDDKEYAEYWARWMTDNWRISIASSLAYILLVFSGKYYMQSRPKYELRPLLIAWNIVLAVFSITGTVRVWPDFLRTLFQHGVVYSVCNNSYAYGITGFWSLMFVLSKLPELVDTLFIVLRKQELIFLHWYHHATVLVYCWYSYKDLAASGRWFMSMNYLVHGLMYSYYAFKAMRVKVGAFFDWSSLFDQLFYG